MFAIGTEEEAGFILYYHLQAQASTNSWEYPEPPEGWTRLGSGCYRVAYLAPSGVVYKVQGRYDKDGDRRWQSNFSEVQNLRRHHLKRLPKGCRIPRWNSFEFPEGKIVVAMEKFDRLVRSLTWQEREDTREARVRMLDAVDGIYDTHDANLAYDDKTKEVAIIDWGG